MTVKICTKCRSKHQNKGQRCDNCQVKKDKQPRAKKVTSPIYGTSRWQRLRNRKKKNKPLCEDCLERGVVMPMYCVDHIVEIKDGGEPFDYDNLRSLCRVCHGRKTVRVARERL